MSVVFGKSVIAQWAPPYLIAEIGINHNGSLDLALDLIGIAQKAGFDAVKFQKRTNDLCVPETMKRVPRSTPWGEMTYLDYRKRMEFEKPEYDAIDDRCRSLGISWFASVWDIPALEFIASYKVACIKIPSACLTHHALLRHAARQNFPVLLSTGMSTLDEIRAAMTILGDHPTVLLQCVSAYPSPDEDINLRCIKTLHEEFLVPVGYSGHEKDTLPSVLAVGLGACVIERHITLGRSLWGSDQSLSLEPEEMGELIHAIRRAYVILGDGNKQLRTSELAALNKLRRNL